MRATHKREGIATKQCKEPKQKVSEREKKHNTHFYELIHFSTTAAAAGVAADAAEKQQAVAHRIDVKCVMLWRNLLRHSDHITIMRRCCRGSAVVIL